MTTKTKWVIDPTHAEIAFKIKHLMISNVKGNFSEFEVTAFTDGDDFSSAEINVKINAASINTGVADRDAHLKSPDFFDVEKYPSISFLSKSFTGAGSEYTLNGDFTIKEVTKPVSLYIEFGGIMTDPWGNVKAGFNIEGKINRKDFGLNWNAALEAGGVLVGEDVKISAEIEMLKVVEG